MQVEAPARSVARNSMKILVYGAGVLGSLYAARLSAAGYDVAVLDRLRRLADVRQHGIVLEDATSGQQMAERVEMVAELEPEDRYDLVLVPVRKTHLSSVLPTLAKNRRTPNVLFMVNSAAGPDEIVEALGGDRVLLGFPGAGGTLEGPVVSYKVLPGWVQPTTMGELDGRVSPRLRLIADAFRAAEFPVALSPDMVSWQKTHVALVSPIANAIYAAGGDNYRLARTRDALALMIRAWREGFRVLEAIGTPITPPRLKVLKWIPEPLQVVLWQRVLDTKFAEIVATRHANAARDEMKQLADEFMELRDAGDVPTPVIDRLHSYIDPSTPPIPEGSSEIPLDWRDVGTGLGAALVIGSVLALVWTRRR